MIITFHKFSIMHVDISLNHIFRCRAFFFFKIFSSSFLRRNSFHSFSKKMKWCCFSLFRVNWTNHGRFLSLKISCLQNSCDRIVFNFMWIRLNSGGWGGIMCAWNPKSSVIERYRCNELAIFILTYFLLAYHWFESQALIINHKSCYRNAHWE